MKNKLVTAGVVIIVTISGFMIGVRVGVNKGFAYYETASATHRAFEITEELLALREGNVADVMALLEQRLNYHISISESAAQDAFITSFIREEFLFGLENPLEQKCISAYRRTYVLRPNLTSQPNLKNQLALVDRFVAKYSTGKNVSAECAPFNVPPY